MRIGAFPRYYRFCFSFVFCTFERSQFLLRCTNLQHNTSICTPFGHEVHNQPLVRGLRLKVWTYLFSVFAINAYAIRFPIRNGTPYERSVLESVHVTFLFATICYQVSKKFVSKMNSVRKCAYFFSSQQHASRSPIRNGTNGISPCLHRHHC